MIIWDGPLKVSLLKQNGWYVKITKLCHNTHLNIILQDTTFQLDLQHLLMFEMYIILVSIPTTGCWPKNDHVSKYYKNGWIHGIYSSSYWKKVLDQYHMSVLYTGFIHWCKIFTIIDVTFWQWRFYNSKYLFYMQMYQTKSPNSEFIATQIDPDPENSEDLTQQIISSMQYFK